MRQRRRDPLELVLTWDGEFEEVELFCERTLLEGILLQGLLRGEGVMGVQFRDEEAGNPFIPEC